jgi:hypothetical protein
MEIVDQFESDEVRSSGQTQATELLKYEAPAISRLSLFAVIAGPGGSVLDDNFNGNRMLNQPARRG